MKTYLKYLSLTILGTFLISTVVYGATALFPTGGGTGKSSATAGDVGKVIKVLDDSPFTYEFATDNTGGSGTFPFSADTNYNQVVYSTSTPTLWFKSGLFASTTSYFVNASSTMQTISSNLWLPSLSTGGLGINSSGLLYGGATTTAGTGLTYSGNAFTVNTSQNIATLSNLTGNGFVKTSGGVGTLSVDTATYESALTAGLGLTRSVNDFFCDTASGSVFGCLASADWTTFNNKQTSSLTKGNFLVGDDAGVAQATSTIFISSTGNVGIGTTTPYAKLSVVGETVSSYFTATSTTATSTVYNSLRIGASNISGRGALTVAPSINNQANSPFVDGGFGSAVFVCENCGALGANLINIGNYGTGPAGINTFLARGTISSPTATQSGDDIYFMGGRGYGTSVWNTGSKAVINFEASQNYTDTANGTRIIFENTLNDSITRTERMRIENTGNVGIGTTSPYAKLSVVGETIASHFTATSTTATSTFQGGLYAYSPTATSTPYIYSKGTGFGGRLIMEDEGGGACTEITTKTGVVNARVISCPTEL